jgi:signal transduction histidine kinase/ligand-binding sensor domain-containing protein
MKILFPEKILLTLFIFLIGAGVSYSQIAEQKVLHARHLSVRDGLSSNLEYCLFEDSRGFMWFGTGAGLDKYDGHTFKKYLQHTEDSIGNCIEWQSWNWTTSITEDNSGTIWAARGLLVSINRKTGKETWYRHDKNNPNSIGENFVGVAFADSRGRVWIGLATGQLDLFEQATKTFRHFDFLKRNVPAYNKFEGIKQISEREDGRLIISTGGFGNVMIFDPNTGTFTDAVTTHGDAGSGFFSEVPFDNLYHKSLSVYSDTINKTIVLFQGTPFHLSLKKITVPRDRFSLLNFYPDKTLLYRGNEKYWFTSETSGLLEIDFKNENISIVTVLDEQKSPIRVLDIFRSREGQLWMGTSKGLYVADEKENPFHTFILHNDSRYDESPIPIRALLIDNEQTLWAGTGHGSVFRYDPVTAQFRNAIKFPSNSKYPLPYKINCIVQDHSSRLWMTVRGGSLYNSEPPFTIATRRSKKKLSVSEEAAESTWGAFIDSEGILWAGYMHFGSKEDSAFGLLRIDPNTMDIKLFSYMPDHTAMGLPSIHDRDKNTLWLVAGDKLCVFDKRTEQITKIYSHDPNNHESISKGGAGQLFTDHKNRLWFPTESGGLDLFNEKGETFTHYPIILPKSESSFCMLEDSSGKFWIATDNGIICFDPDTRDCTTYTTEDGLANDPLRLTTAVKSQAGQFFFGGADGVISFYPEQVQKSVVKSPLFLTNFKVSDSVWYDEISNGDTIKLTYNDNYFSVDASYLNFGNPSKKQYVYMLEGYDKDWIKAGERRTIAYNNVDPGNYKLRVRVFLTGEKNFQNDISAFIFIAPPFWMTWWFRTIAALAIIFLLFYLYNQRRKKQQKFQNQLDDARDSERVNLAGELHDGPLQDLYGARFLLEPLLSRETYDHSAIKLDELLVKVRRDLRAMTGELQIPQFDSGFAEELHIFCAAFAERHPTIHVTENIKSEKKTLTKITQQNLFRLFRTAMANVAKHANASKVEIIFATQDDAITLKVIDNGSGFMVPNELGALVQSKHYGLFLMHSYAHTIKAKCSVLSKPGLGTEVGVFL